MQNAKYKTQNYITKLKSKKLDGMVNVSGKKETKRVAKAQARVRLKKELLYLIKKQGVMKGNVLEQARAAGIFAAKKTSDLIPLCHPLRISEVTISFDFTEGGISIFSQVSALERTGVEMEALVGCCISALTIYDMCKMYDRSIEITDIMLLEKRGGKSGIFSRKEKD